MNLQSFNRNRFRLAMVFYMIVMACQLKAQQMENELLKIKEKFELVGGTALMFNKTKIIDLVNFGNSQIENNLPVTNKTQFRIASISKTITAIAFMQLVEQNKVSLDVDISKLLQYDCRNPFYPDRFITPRMLLSHTSSLTDDPKTYDRFLADTYEQNPVPDLSTLVSVTGSNYSKELFLNKQPGTYFNYCNLNYGILGTIIEKISGVRFDEYCQKFIFSPMNINATFNVNKMANLNDLATIYRKIEGEWKSQCDDHTTLNSGSANVSGYQTGSNAIRFAPQGGLRISGSDLAKIFMLFLNDGKYLNKQIISKSSLNQMKTSQWKFDGSNGDDARGLFLNWGLGLHLITNTTDRDQIFSGNVSMFGHSGDAYGLVSDAFVETQKGIGFVFITNGCGKGYQDSDCSSFYDVEKDVFDFMNTVYQKQQIKGVLHK